MLATLLHIDGRTLREGDAVGIIKRLEIHLSDADAEYDRHQRPEQFAVKARIECRLWQHVVAIHRLILVKTQHRLPAHLPDEDIGSLASKPRLQHIAYRESSASLVEEPPCALQP